MPFATHKKEKRNTQAERLTCEEEKKKKRAGSGDGRYTIKLMKLQQTGTQSLGVGR